MESPEFDFECLGQELRIMATADALGDLATANERLLGAELQFLLAQARIGTALTGEEEDAIWNNVVGALDAKYVALCDIIAAKELLKNVE